MSEPLEEYAQAVEAHLSSWRGRPHVLSPRDFTLLRGWHAARVPLGVVLAGIDLACAGGTPVSSLAYCRARVEALAGGVGGDPAPSAAAVDPDLGRRVEGLLLALRGLGPRAASGLARLEARVQEVADLLSVSRQPNPQWVGRTLREIDEAVGAAALEAAGPEQRAAFQEEAARALARQRGHVSEEALTAALRRHQEQRARALLGLPRLGLD